MTPEDQERELKDLMDKDQYKKHAYECEVECERTGIFRNATEYNTTERG